MNRPTLFSITVLLAAACGARGAAVATTAQSDVRDAVFAIDHPFFPLRPGTGWSYAGEADGARIREEVDVQEVTEDIDGVSCLVVVQQRFIEEQLEETTFHWYSGGPDGRLWIFGELTLDAYGDEVAADSWQAGRDGASPVPWLMRTPAAGDLYELDLPTGFETVVVEGDHGGVTVPAGSFSGCLVTTEQSGTGTDQDLVLYAPGVGRVLEQDNTTRLVLVGRR